MKKHRRVVGQMKQSQEPQRLSAEWIAQHAKRAMDYLAPLVQSQNMSPTEALVLVAMQMDHDITNKQSYLNSDEIMTICNMILTVWQQGLFEPCAAYPYTLEETLKAGGSEE